MDVRLHELRGFVTLADEGTFTRAAGRLFITQPALTKQIQSLEASLQTTLVVRGPAGIALTPAGEALLPWARQILTLWDSAQRDLKTLRANESRTLIVGLALATFLEPFSEAVRLFREAQPDYDVQVRQVSFADATMALDDETPDVALGWLPVPNPERYRWKVLYEDERWIALPADHALATRTSIRFEELVHEPFIALPESAGPLRSFWLGEDARTFPARVGAVVRGAEEALAALAAKKGIALIASSDAAAYPRLDYVAVPLTGLPPCRFAVVWRAGEHRAAVQSFVEAVSHVSRDRRDSVSDSAT